MQKWKERVFDFALGVLFSMAITLATIYPRVVSIEQRLSSVERTLEKITTVSVKP